MWFPLALTAMLMLVIRRSSEKTLTAKIPATSMAWLQQFVALPFMIVLLPFAAFYNPLGLSEQFYWIIAVYTVLGAVDVILYFKAISLGDISVISAMLSLTVVSALIGAYFVLGQTPSTLGLMGAVCILIGAYLAGKKTVSLGAVANPGNRIAVICILVVVVMRGFYSQIEVFALRETNPIYFNFLSSLLMVPAIMLIMYLWGKKQRKPVFSKELLRTAITHRLGLLLIGVTFTINLTCTYAAKLAADNAAYVTTIKGAQILPMMVLGVLLFKEKVQARQWVGMTIILVGMVLFSRT